MRTLRATSRSLRRVVGAAVVAATGVLALGVAPAQAATPSWTGTITTYHTAEITSTSSTTTSWDPTTHVVYITLRTGLLPAGTCVTAYFDWQSVGHHDARALRSCQSDVATGQHFSEIDASNLGTRPNKLGLCFATANKRGTCVVGLGASYVPMNWAPWPNPGYSEPCDLSWVRRNADGTTSSFFDRHPLKGDLVGSTC